MAELTFYQVRISGPDWDDIKYTGTSEKDAVSEFKSLSITDLEERLWDSSGIMAIVQKYTNKYLLVKQLDDNESQEDYPIEDYYDDTDVYEIETEGEWEETANKNLDRINKKTDEVLSDVQSHYGGKYTTHYLDKDGKFTLKLRIADHSGKWKNKGYDDYFLSIVIASHNKTADFKTTGPEGLSRDEEEEFDEDYTSEQIIDFINEKIQELKHEVNAKQPIMEAMQHNKTESAVIQEIEEKIKESCVASRYNNLCIRVQTEGGLAYVVNRCITMMSKDKIHLSAALAALESEEEGIN